MKRTIPLLALVAFGLCQRSVFCQEVLPTPSELTCSPSYPCEQGYRPGWLCMFRVSHSGYHSCSRSQVTPVGKSVHSIMSAQVENGIRAQLMLYHFDFGIGEGADQLNPHGMQGLRRMAQLSMQTGLPVLIQSSFATPTLDERRRQSVVKQLVEINDFFTGDMVLLGEPQHRGLRGEEVIAVQESLLQNTQNRGPIFGSAIGD